MPYQQQNLLRQVAELEQKLAQLPKPQNRHEKRIRTLRLHYLRRAKRILLALRDEKEARFWVNYPLEEQGSPKET